MNRTYLTQGASRNVFTVDDNPDVIVKRPIPERFKAGNIQNQCEYTNYNLAKEAGLSCFAKIIDCTSDFSELVVEKCGKVSYDTIRNKFSKLYQRYGISTTEDFLKFFAWRVSLCVRKLCNAMVGRNISPTVENFKMFLTQEKDLLLIENVPSVNMVCDMMCSNDEDTKLFREIIEFYLMYPRNLLVDDLWQPDQYGLTKDGRIVVIDYGYSVDLSESEYYKVGKRRCPVIDKANFTKEITCLNTKFMMTDDYRTQMESGGWWSMSSKTVFMRPDVARATVEELRRHVDCLRIFRVDSDFETKMAFEELIDEKRRVVVDNIEFSKEPEVGLVPFEFFMTEDNCVRCFFCPTLRNEFGNETIRSIRSISDNAIL